MRRQGISETTATMLRGGVVPLGKHRGRPVADLTEAEARGLLSALADPHRRSRNPVERMTIAMLEGNLRRRTAGDATAGPGPVVHPPGRVRGGRHRGKSFAELSDAALSALHGNAMKIGQAAYASEIAAEMRRRKDDGRQLRRVALKARKRSQANTPAGRS